MPVSPKWTSLLRERSDVWFSPKLIEALRVIQGSLGNSEEVRRTAGELQAEGYVARFPRSGSRDEQRIVASFFHDLIDALWPEPVAKALWDKDRERGSEDAEALIRFLEIDPFFFRTGYMKPLAIRRLGQCPLTIEQRARIFLVLRRIVLSGWERQMKDWHKLGRLCAAEKIVVEAMASENPAVVQKGTVLGLVLLGETKLLGQSKQWMRKSPSLGTIQWISEPEAIQAFLDTRTEEELAHLETRGFDGLMDYWRDKFWAEAMAVVREGI